MLAGKYLEVVGHTLLVDGVTHQVTVGGLVIQGYVQVLALNIIDGYLLVTIICFLASLFIGLSQLDTGGSALDELARVVVEHGILASSSHGAVTGLQYVLVDRVLGIEDVG